MRPLINTKFQKEIRLIQKHLLPYQFLIVLQIGFRLFPLHFIIFALVSCRHSLLYIVATIISSVSTTRN